MLLLHLSGMSPIVGGIKFFYDQLYAALKTQGSASGNFVGQAMKTSVWAIHFGEVVYWDGVDTG